MRIFLLLLALCSGLQAVERPFLAGSFFADSRSLEIGELITVLIMESGSGSNSASVNTKREDALQLGASGSGGPLTFMPSISGASDASNEHKSKGSNARSSSLSGKITAEIVAIEPGGILVIEGLRIVELDGEEQLTEISGRIRPQDVQSDNTVYSYNISDAVIRYSGRGIVREAQRRSFFNWLFGWLI